VKIAITGHRPEKINDWQFVEHQLRLAFTDNNASVVIQGMAAGVDLTAAKIAYREGIPFWCAVPWKTHTARKDWALHYEQALQHAHRIEVVTDVDHYPGAWVYQKRNEWMVDHADIVVAVWDGTPGGTRNCVKYAQKVGKPIFQIEPISHSTMWLP
jgi:uncharacterized phage-like protein YoqJ